MGKKFWLVCIAYVLCMAFLLSVVVSGIGTAFHWVEQNGLQTLWTGAKK